MNIQACRIARTNRTPESAFTGAEELQLSSAVTYERMQQLRVDAVMHVFLARESAHHRCNGAP